MAELKASHDTQDEIAEEYRELYTEKGDKWELTGITGIKTQADIDRIQVGLTKERDAHKVTKDKLAVWGDLDHDDVVVKLDKYPELETAAAGKLDEAAIEEIVTKRVEGTLRSKLSPLERDNKKLKTTNAELTEANAGFVQSNTRRKIHDHVRSALIAAKVIPEAHDDALMLAERLFEITEDEAILTRDKVGTTPGLDGTAWLADIQDKKPHWWPASEGGGARGSRPGGGFQGKNPWSHEGWNMTEQGRIYTDKGKEYADRLAKAAGTTVGGPQPKAKVQA